MIEDDYVAAVAGAAYTSLHGGSEGWSVIRSVSKVFGPDLRIALLAGDPLTVSRVEGRQLLGAGWVSHLLQHLLERGWAVSPGERYRHRAPPGIRITTAGLAPDDAERLAAAIDDSVHATAGTYAG